MFVGNEVIARANQSEVAPFIKAATRDMKAYRDSKGMRKIPVGYSAADIAELRPMLQNYLACGNNTDDTVDFFGLNAYEWCNPKDTFEISGYKTLNEMTEGYPVPIFFSETGCNTNRPRLFLDQAAILGPQMNDIWSGTIVYEWIEETNNYGLISYAEPVAKTMTGENIHDGFVRKGTPTPVQPDFSNLANVWKTLTPKGVPSSEYTPDVTAPACPTYEKGGWQVDGDVPLPTINQELTIVATIVVSSTSAGTATATTTEEVATSTSAGAAVSDGQFVGVSGGLVSLLLGVIAWL